MNAEEFRMELLASVHSRAEAHGIGTREAFVAELTDRLRDSGEMPDIEGCPESLTGQRQRRLEIDGFALDEADSSLHLVLGILDPGSSISVITLSDAREAAFNRLEGLYEQARSGWLTANIEESRPLWALARDIERGPRPAALRLHVVTDRRISERLREIKPGQTSDGVPIEYQIWDVSRLLRIHEARSARDDLIVDLPHLPGGGLPVLPATGSGGDYEAYLAVMPASALADIFIRYGSRLLEGNVRTFLGRSGNINKNIAKTLIDEPSRFFAYNNGLAATASSINLERGTDGLIVTGVTDLQIVNGAQTTASLATLRRENKLPEADVFVPMKLSVIAPDAAEELVPRISRFANSQNAVKASDFFANHPFHRRMETISRRVLAPAQSGSQVQTHWFYERARGQYLNEQAGLTAASKAQWQRSNPRGQVITKTDLAKIETCFEQLPDVACKGAEKAFVAFADRVSKAWQDEAARDAYGDDWFRSAVARQILFRATEKLVSRASWYAPGTRAQVVAHTTAKLANMTAVASGGGQLDYLRVWARQDVGDALTEQLDLIAERVMAVLLDPPQSGMNVGEWAKQQACRNRVFSTEVPQVDGFDTLLISRMDKQAGKRSEREGQRVATGVEALQEVMRLGGDYWARVRDIARKHGLSSPEDDKALAASSAYPRKLPQEFQAIKAVGVLKRIQDAGRTPPVEAALWAGPDLMT